MNGKRRALKALVHRRNQRLDLARKIKSGHRNPNSRRARAARLGAVTQTSKTRILGLE